MLQFLSDPLVRLFLVAAIITLISLLIRTRNRRQKAQKERRLFEAALKSGDLARAKRRLRGHYRALGGGRITARKVRAMEKELTALGIGQNSPLLMSPDSKEKAITS